MDPQRLETFFLKTQMFVLVCQISSEDKIDFFYSVEQSLAKIHTI